MDNQTKKLLIVVGIAVAILWFCKPKNNMVDSMRKGGSKKLEAPKTLDSKLAEQQHNGSVGIQAMRDAINNGETKNKNQSVELLNSAVAEFNKLNHDNS